MFNTTFIAWSPQRVLLFSFLKIHFLQTCWQEIRCVCRRLLEFSTTAHPPPPPPRPPPPPPPLLHLFQHLPTRLPSPRHPSFLTSNPLSITSAERSTEAAWPLIGQAPGWGGGGEGGWRHGAAHGRGGGRRVCLGLEKYYKNKQQ